MTHSSDQRDLSWRPPATTSRVGITLETYILEGMMGFPAATGAFTSLLNQIGLAAKLITSKVRRGGLAPHPGLHRGDQRPGRAGPEARRRGQRDPDRLAGPAAALRRHRQRGDGRGEDPL